MKSLTSKRFDEQYTSLPERIKTKIDKQLRLLINNLRHPSLRAKKYDEASDVWQARVNGHYRFYFRIKGNIYTIAGVQKHKD